MKVEARFNLRLGLTFSQPKSKTHKRRAKVKNKTTLGWVYVAYAVVLVFLGASLWGWLDHTRLCWQGLPLIIASLILAGTGLTVGLKGERLLNNGVDSGMV